MIDTAKLKATRVLRNMSREELGRKTGLSIQTIFRIENGMTKDPGIETITLITKALLIDLDDILVKESIN